MTIVRVAILPLGEPAEVESRAYEMHCIRSNKGDSIVFFSKW